MVAGGSQTHGLDVFDPGLSGFVRRNPVVPAGRIVLVDAGSRSARGGGGEASIVKLAALKYDGGRIMVLHPAVPVP
jgi:hypothetical protein